VTFTNFLTYDSCLFLQRRVEEEVFAERENRVGEGCRDSMIDQVKEADRAAGGEYVLGCPAFALLIRWGGGEEWRDIDQGEIRGMHFHCDIDARWKSESLQ
jgi:hypothetical protein